jgi:hypothetical protein
MLTTGIEICLKAEQRPCPRRRRHHLEDSGGHRSRSCLVGPTRRLWADGARNHAPQPTLQGSSLDQGLHCHRGGQWRCRRLNVRRQGGTPRPLQRTILLWTTRMATPARCTSCRRSRGTMTTVGSETLMGTVQVRISLWLRVWVRLPECTRLRCVADSLGMMWRVSARQKQQYVLPTPELVDFAPHAIAQRYAVLEALGRLWLVRFM